jgi:fatty-acyl-CoA synthase
LLRKEIAAAVVGEVGLAPAAVVILPPGKLPKTTSGKLRRAEARTRYLSGQLHLIPEGRPS